MSNINRRDFLKISGSSLIGLTLGCVALRANAQEQVSLDNPLVKQFQYVHETAVEGQKCSNCLFIQGEDGAEWRPCPLFQNKLVKANGWCNAWQKKPG